MKQKKQINLYIFVIKTYNMQKMKGIKLFSILTIIFLITSCSITKKIEKSIVGKWEITLIKTVTDEVSNDTYNEMFKNLLFKKMLKGSYIEFNVDKTYELYLLDESFKDSWSVSEDGSKILGSKKERYFKIISKTEETMVLKSINGTDKVLIDLKKI
ncbi:MAG: hypothetical protein K8R54_07740 [Bacteroidales bacterium]|nr:hypothetical protein [Bacteroidales bacterium]